MALQREKSRKEKRREARQAHNHNKNESWRKYQRERRIREEERESRRVENSEKILAEKQLKQNSGDWDRRKRLYEAMSVEDEKGSGKKSVAKKATKVENRKKGVKRKATSKFEEYLGMELEGGDRVAQEDLELERRLAKRLKVKGGKLGGLDDGINMLFKGIPSVLDFDGKGTLGVEDSPVEMDDDVGGVSELEEASVAEAAQGGSTTDSSPSKKPKRRKKSKKKQEDGLTDAAADGASELTGNVDKEGASQGTPTEVVGAKSGVKYVAPHLRSRAGDEPEEHTQIRRRVRGLLNRLSESNVESVTGEVASIFQSVDRSIATQIISVEVLAACSSGPRGNEQYAAVFAVFVAGMACSVGMDFSAKLMASLAKSFQDEYLKEDDLSLHNLTLLLSSLCIFGVCSSDLIYDFLTILTEQLTEIDVSTILTVLQCCGIKLRGDDPGAMKDFIQSIQNRVNELKSSARKEQANINNKRMEFMLETIIDIKNNKKRPKEESAQHTRIRKWLQKLRVENILIRGLKWSKLLDPHKKGQWWLSGDMASATDNVEDVASTINKEALEAQKLLHLAAAQRMNTDIRRQIFCIIMSAEDYLDAYEKLLRLDLPGTQDRDILRVLIDCCLQEKVFNKYYTLLASKLCEHNKNHKFTLQYCLWDRFKELESTPLALSMHLAKFVAEIIASFTLSLAVLKTVELGNARQLTAQMIMHFRMLFEFIFEHPDALVWNVFTRVAVAPELEALRHGIEFFIGNYVVKTNKAMGNKYKLAKKALNNTEGVLM